MKKFFSFLMAALMLLGVGLMISCSDDEEEEQSAPGSIIGTWQAFDGDGGSVVMCFEEDGTYWEYQTYDGYQEDTLYGTYAYDGENLEVTYAYSGDSYLLTAKVSGNKLYISSNGVTVILTRIA